MQKKFKFTNETILTINDLNTEWNNKRLQKVYIYNDGIFFLHTKIFISSQIIIISSKNNSSETIKQIKLYKKACLLVKKLRINNYSQKQKTNIYH